MNDLNVKIIYFLHTIVITLLWFICLYEIIFVIKWPNWQWNFIPVQCQRSTFWMTVFETTERLWTVQQIIIKLTVTHHQQKHSDSPSCSYALFYVYFYTDMFLTCSWVPPLLFMIFIFSPNKLSSHSDKTYCTTIHQFHNYMNVYLYRTRFFLAEAMCWSLLIMSCAMSAKSFSVCKSAAKVRSYGSVLYKITELYFKRNKIKNTEN